MEAYLMKILIIMCIILLIIFLPIPIKITIFYEHNKLKVYIYKKSLNLPFLNNKFNVVEKVKVETEIINHTPRIKKITEKLYENYFKQNPYRGKIKNKLKPSIKVDFNLAFGFEDAAITGMSYGLFSTVPYTLRNLIEKRLKIKRYLVNIEPCFNNPTLKFRIISIFSLNLVQIIYMFIVVIKK
jgi:hypothetical protein